MTSDDLRTVLASIHRYRTVSTPFDVVMGMPTDGSDLLAAAAQVAPFIEAGLTWWIEPLDSWRGPLEVMRQRIKQVPPRQP